MRSAQLSSHHMKAPDFQDTKSLQTDQPDHQVPRAFCFCSTTTIDAGAMVRESMQLGTLASHLSADLGPYSQAFPRLVPVALLICNHLFATPQGRTVS